MVSEELEKGLREEIDGYISSRLGGIQEEVERLRSQVNEAFTRLVERTESAAQSDSSVAFNVGEFLRAAYDTGIQTAAAESARTKTSSEIAILKSSVSELDDQRTQGDILSVLVNRAASFAPRVVFFVIRNEQAIGWRGRGLEGTVGDDAVREISLPLSAETVLGDVVQSRATWSGTPGTKSDDHLFINRLGGEMPQRMVAVPLIARGRAVAVLYADSAGLDSDAINLEAIEMLVRVAGMAVELLAVKRPAPIKREAVAAPAEEAPASQEAETRTQESIAAQAETSASAANEQFEKGFDLYPQDEVAEAEAAPVPVEESHAQEVNAPEPQVETVSAHAVVEPAPSETFAPQATPPQAPLGTARRYGSSDAELPVQVNDEEKPLHNDARRFARLLVSEIKLYNEQKVREGRSQGDLYERLREDIERSRQMYDKRVAPQVASRYDYFHQELINTLAEGDPAKLGAGYPGASATV